jgi:uncharacterized repeat protein (TIGR03847 family)
VSRIIYEYDPVERFVCGTVGEPGDRAFFIQARTGPRLTSVSLEKLQAAALGDRVGVMIKEIKRANPLISYDRANPDTEPLEQPIFEEFRVGVIGLSFDTETERVLVELQCITEAQSEEEELVEDEEEDAPDLLRVSLTLSQAEGFAKRTSAVIGAGRLPCPFCGIPIDPSGHLCPRANGYRR